MMVIVMIIMKMFKMMTLKFQTNTWCWVGGFILQIPDPAFCDDDDDIDMKRKENDLIVCPMMKQQRKTHPGC